MKRTRPPTSRPNRTPGTLSREDRILWNRVAETTTPTSKKKGQFLKHEMQKLMDAAAQGAQVNKAPSMLVKPPATVPELSASLRKAGLQSSPIEERIARKLARGRQAIDARIDLHGMTQDRARVALLDFLNKAQQANHRIVLVITGRGMGGQGVLRTNVPRWLSLPAFSRFVNGHRESHVSHGGEGALYVRIRKPAQRSRS